MYVCLCRGVTDREIRNEVDKGATHLRDLRRELGVATECGRCASCARTVLKEALAEQRAAETLLPISA